MKVVFAQSLLLEDLCASLPVGELGRIQRLQRGQMNVGDGVGRRERRGHLDRIELRMRGSQRGQKLRMISTVAESTLWRG